MTENPFGSVLEKIFDFISIFNLEDTKIKVHFKSLKTLLT